MVGVFLFSKKYIGGIMIEALYGIEFISKTDEGYGVVVLETDRIFGGDSSFVYVGKYLLVNNLMEVDVKCVNYRGVLESIFDNLKEFNLYLSRKTDDEHKEFMLEGYMIENRSKTLQVKLTRIAELP